MVCVCIKSDVYAYRCVCIWVCVHMGVYAYGCVCIGCMCKGGWVYA